MLAALKDAKSNRSIAKFTAPKAVFIVDIRANKKEIAMAVEQIYGDKVRVQKVNTILMKPKTKRLRGNEGSTARVKKAVVTFRPGDQIE